MPGLATFHHAKLPVSDVEASSAWYQRVLGLALEIEFREEGRLMGVALVDAAGTAPLPLRLALRHDPGRAAALSGFDVLAFGVPTRDGVREWASRLDDLGVAHGGVVTG